MTQTLAQVLKEAGGVQAQTADAVEELQQRGCGADDGTGDGGRGSVGDGGDCGK